MGPGLIDRYILTPYLHPYQVLRIRHYFSELPFGHSIISLKSRHFPQSHLVSRMPMWIWRIISFAATSWRQGIRPPLGQSFKRADSQDLAISNTANDRGLTSLRIKLLSQSIHGGNGPWRYSFLSANVTIVLRKRANWLLGNLRLHLTDSIFKSELPDICLNSAKVNP